MHKFTHISTYSRPVTIAPGTIVQKFGVWGHVPTLNAQIELTEAWYSTREDAESQASLFRGYNDLDEPDEPWVEIVESGEVLLVGGDLAAYDLAEDEDEHD